MSYTFTLHCGCSVYVACDPASNVAHSRVIESRGTTCPIRRHEIGLKLRLWEILPPPSARAQVIVLPDSLKAIGGSRKAS